MWEPGEWMEAAEQLSEHVHREIGYTTGVMDSLEMAKSLGYDVIFDRRQESRGRLKRFGKKISIFLRPDDRPERIQWAVSHEIGETLAHLVFGALGANPRDCDPGLREHVANLLASRLLLPRSDFFPAADACQESLPELKERYHTASYELIATRLLDRALPRCVTVVDQGRITKRRASRSNCSQDFSEPERLCWKQAHTDCKYQERHAAGLFIRCWPIHEDHWKREILLTAPSQLETTEAEALQTEATAEGLQEVYTA